MKLFQFLINKLLEVKGTASVSRSVDYVNFVENRYPADAYKGGGRLVPIHFSHTVGAGTYTTGTTDTLSGLVKLFTHPKGWMFTGLFVSGTALSASAGVGQTPVIGDGTTANKYMLASDADAAAWIGLVNGESYGYTPTANMPVTLTYGATGTPVATTGRVTGTFHFIPGS